MKVSSRRSATERKLDILKANLKEGDTLIVSELSRLGRNLGEVESLVYQLYSEKIKFIAIKSKVHLSDKYDL